MNQLLQVSPTWLPVIDALVKASVVLTIAAVAAAALRRASAASRHLVWTCALLAALALPVVSIAVPRWQLPILLLESTPAEMSYSPAGAGAAEGAADPPAVDRAAPRNAAAPVPSASPRSLRLHLSWSATVAAVWALGVVAVLGRLAGGVLAVRLLSRKTRSPQGAPWLPLARQLASELRVARVKFRRSPGSMPMTWGILRPVVVLPSAADAWPAERLRIALLHELAHVKRADCLTHMLAQAACALYWMHPLVWVAARRARAERERACDDFVLAYGTSGPDYADELLEIARLAPAPPFAATAATASLAMARRSQLEGRLMAILDPSVPRTGVSRLRTISATAIALVVLMPLAAVQPWAYAEAAVVPPPRGERSQPPTATTPAPHGVTIPKPAPAVPARQADLSQSVLEGVKEVSMEGIAQAIAEALPEVVAAVDAALLQNPRPQPNPDTNVVTDRGAKSKADPKIVAALTEALKDTDKEVRESALHALVQMRDPGIYEPLVQALKDPSAGVRESAASGLARLRDKRAVGPLSSVLNDTSAGVREQAVFALGQLRDVASLEPLTNALRDESAQVREQAAFALGQLRDQRSIPALTSALKDASANVREQAVFALGQLRAPSAMDQLIAALKDDDADVRGQAAFALGQIRDPRAVDALAAMLKDPDADVRQQAAFALGQLAR